MDDDRNDTLYLEGIIRIKPYVPEKKILKIPWCGGAGLRYIRERHGNSFVVAGKKCNLSPDVFRKLEKGISRPSPPTLEKIEKGYQCFFVDVEVYDHVVRKAAKVNSVPVKKLGRPMLEKNKP